MISLPDPRRRRTVAAGLLVARELAIGASGCGVNGGLLGLVVGTLVALAGDHAGPIHGAALVAPVDRLAAGTVRRASAPAIVAALVPASCVSLPGPTWDPGDVETGRRDGVLGARADRPRRFARSTPMPAAAACAPAPAARAPALAPWPA